MTLTRNFKDTVKARVERDEVFRKELFREAVECLLSGDVSTGKAVLRDFINATIGFQILAEATKTSAKSLMRMFSDKGNPRAGNLLTVLSVLQTENGIQLKVEPQTVKMAASKKRGSVRKVKLKVKTTKPKAPSKVKAGKLVRPTATNDRL